MKPATTAQAYTANRAACELQKLMAAHKLAELARVHREREERIRKAQGRP